MLDLALGATAAEPSLLAGADFLEVLFALAWVPAWSAEVEVASDSTATVDASPTTVAADLVGSFLLLLLFLFLP